MTLTPINIKKSNFNAEKSRLTVGLVNMVSNKYKYFTVRKAAQFLLLLGVVSCNAVSDALIVGEESFNVPLSSNIDSISVESIFYFGAYF